MFLGLGSRQHGAVLIHPHKMGRFVSGVRLEPLLLPKAQNRFHQLEIPPTQQQPKRWVYHVQIINNFIIEWTYRFWYLGTIDFSPCISLPMARSIHLICRDPISYNWYPLLGFAYKLHTPYPLELLGGFGEQDGFFSSRLLLYEKGKYYTSFPNHLPYSFDSLFVRKGHVPNGSSVIRKLGQRWQHQLPAATLLHLPNPK